MIRIDSTETPMDANDAKRGEKPTSELFTVILCSPNFAVSGCSKLKIIR